MKIHFSDKAIEVEDNITVLHLLEQQKVATPQNVTVVVNNAFLPTERYECFSLKEGDTVAFRTIRKAESMDLLNYRIDSMNETLGKENKTSEL